MKGTPLGRCGGVFEGCDAFAMEVVDLFQDSLLDLLRRERRNEDRGWGQTKSTPTFDSPRRLSLGYFSSGPPIPLSPYTPKHKAVVSPCLQRARIGKQKPLVATYVLLASPFAKVSSFHESIGIQ